MLGGNVYFAQEGPRPDDRGRGTRFVFSAFGQPNGTGLIKIGHALRSISHRVQEVGGPIKRAMTIVGVVEGSPADERALHRRFATSRADPPWPGREWFRPTDDLLAFIRALRQPDWWEPVQFTGNRGNYLYDRARS
jgi:hypothetical protein